MDSAPLNLPDGEILCVLDTAGENNFLTIAKWVKKLHIIAHKDYYPTSATVALLRLCENISAVTIPFQAHNIYAFIACFPNRPKISIYLWNSPNNIDLLNMTLPFHLMADDFEIILEPGYFSSEICKPLKRWAASQSFRETTCVTNDKVIFRVHPMRVRWLALALGFRRKRMHLLPELVQYIAEEYGHM